MKGISDTKLVTFALGQQKKSRFQKAREEKEAKKKADEAEVAAVYDTFVASFKDTEDVNAAGEGRGKKFVRGGRVQAGRASVFNADDDDDAAATDAASGSGSKNSNSGGKGS